MKLVTHSFLSLVTKVAPVHLTGGDAVPSGQHSAVMPETGSCEQARLGETFAVDSAMHKEPAKQYSLLW